MTDPADRRPTDAAPGDPDAGGARAHGPATLGGRLLAIAGGLAVAGLVLSLPAPEALGGPAWRLTAVAALMVVWWVTEAVPVAVTALLPLVLFPALGIVGGSEAAAPYANPLTFLFMGGLMIAVAIERWQLHRRIALHILLRFGTRPSGLLAGFMLTTALISMWMTNTATTVMMLPIVLSVIRLLESDAGAGALTRNRGLVTALLLGVAFSATIGGLGTLIGTAPNVLVAAMLRDTYGIEIGFARWMVLAVPIVFVMLVLTWLVFVKVLFRFDNRPVPNAATTLGAALRALGPLTTPEKRIALVFAAVASAWIGQPLLAPLVPGISDAVIAVSGAALMFLVPAGGGSRRFLLTWDEAARIPWGVLILFGGGLSLAYAVGETGLSLAIGDVLSGLTHLPKMAMIFVFVITILFLTELTSNTATTATFLPIVGAVAVGAGLAPASLMIPACLAASCAFMMPVGTPPNAVVFSTGHLTIAQMARAGFWINVLGALVITVAGTYFVDLAFGDLVTRRPV